MIQIANPIYDSVFKYIMQNNKVCIILLGALLNRDIIEVEVISNELVRAGLKKFAVLRLDFLAKIKNPDGSIETVSIELQKSEKSTEIARFRSYLASLYDTRANDVEVIERKNRRGKTVKIERKNPYHIIAIYILGHALDGIDEPVIYNAPNPVLDIFDQSRTMPKNEHFLLIDDYEDKPEGFNTIVRELARAATDRQTKFEMDIEDEYAEDIEDRIELEDIIEEQKKQLLQQNEQLSQQKEQLSQQNNMIVVLIKSMLAEGKNIESISKTLNISIDQITELIS